jgi:hypothetical protein
MTPATTDPITREAIDQFLSRLTDAQKRYVFLKLSGPILGPIKEKRSFFDEKGDLLGDYLPIPRVQPGQKVGMTDEERAALANVVRKTRPEWAAFYAAKAEQEGANPAGPGT